MRTLFVFCGMLSVLSGCSPYANIKAYDYPKPFHFVLVESVSGSKADLHVKANEWMAKSFVSSREVIQMNDKEAGKIIGKAVFVMKFPSGGTNVSTEHVNYTISIDVKDGRYRCVLSNFYHEGAGTKSMGYGSLEKSEYKVNNFDMSGHLKLIKNRTMDYSKATLAGFKEAMQAENDDF